MGAAQMQPLKNIDLAALPVFCLGFPQDIQAASESESTNAILKKLKQYQAHRVFKYRIRDQKVLAYFYEYSPSVIVIKTWKKEEIVLGIINISKTYPLKVQGVMAILRKQLSIEQKESIFLYLDGKLCHLHQSLTSSTSQKKNRVLYYSKMQISG